MRFQGAKKRLYKVQDLNAIVTRTLQQVLKQNKRSKAMYKHNAILEEERENFNPKNLSIGEESDQAISKRRNKAELQG